MSLYRLDASIRVEGSHSRAIADIVQQEWRDAHRRFRYPPSRRGRPDSGHRVGHRRLRQPHAGGVTHGRAGARAWRSPRP